MLYYPFTELDTHMEKNRKAFKRFFSALSTLDKTKKVLEQNQFCPNSM